MLVEADLLRKPLALKSRLDAGKEADMFDEEIKKPKAHEVGMPIDTMSVEELGERIGLLEDEIKRLQAAIEARGATRKAADAAFKF
jgi:uncharacterized small protein (DUF1192 family)